MYCLSCNYPLSGLSEQRCPECGRAFDPADPATFESGTVSRAGRRAIGFVIAIVLLVVLVVAGGFIYLDYVFDEAFKNFD